MRGCLSISSKLYSGTKNRICRWIQNGQISQVCLSLHVSVSQTIFFYRPVGQKHSKIGVCMIHVVFGQFSWTNDLRMLKNPRNASSLTPIGLGVVPGSLRYFKQLCLGSKFQTYPFQMALKFFPIPLSTYRIFEKNSQEFRSKTLITMIF